MPIYEYECDSSGLRFSRRPRSGPRPRTSDTVKEPAHARVPSCSFARKHVPEADPGYPGQSTSMPALHGPRVANRRPMVDGGMRTCSAGACPPLRTGCGRVRPPDDEQNHPAPSHFHPLTRPSQGHGHSRDLFRHSRAGGNPRANAPRQNGDREMRNHAPFNLWYESMSRRPIRDTPANQPRCRLSTGQEWRIVDRWSMAE